MKTPFFGWRAMIDEAKERIVKMGSGLPIPAKAIGRACTALLQLLYKKGSNRIYHGTRCTFKSINIAKSEF